MDNPKKLKTTKKKKNKQKTKHNMCWTPLYAFTPKNHIFPIAEGGAKFVGVFRVKNHDFTPKNLIFSNFRGGARWVRLPLDPSLPTVLSNVIILTNSLICINSRLLQMLQY
jgi:hypothetical protein